MQGSADSKSARKGEDSKFCWFGGHMASVTPAQLCRWDAKAVVVNNQWVEPHSKRTLFMDTDIWISYNFHMAPNIIPQLIFFHLNMQKRFVAHGLWKNRWWAGFGSWAAVADSDFKCFTADVYWLSDSLPALSSSLTPLYFSLFSFSTSSFCLFHLQKLSRSSWYARYCIYGILFCLFSFLFPKSGDFYYFF